MPRAPTHYDALRADHHAWTPWELHSRGILTAWFDFGDPRHVVLDSTGRVQSVRDVRGTSGFNWLHQSDATRRPLYTFGRFESHARACRWQTEDQLHLEMFLAAHGVTSAGTFTQRTIAMAACYRDATAATALGSHRLYYRGSGKALGLQNIQSWIESASGTPEVLRFCGNAITANSTAVLPCAWFTVLEQSAASAATSLRVGGHPFSTNFGWRGGIGEVLVISDVLTTAEMLALEGYLASRWPVDRTRFPADHRYRNGAPAVGG